MERYESISEDSCSALGLSEHPCNWAGLLFQLAWRKIPGSPLRADRWKSHCGLRIQVPDPRLPPNNPVVLFLNAVLEGAEPYTASSLPDLFCASVAVIDLFLTGAVPCDGDAAAGSAPTRPASEPKPAAGAVGLAATAGTPADKTGQGEATIASGPDQKIEIVAETAAGERPVYSASSESALVASTAEYDFFICHATEDKDNFVSPLAAALQQRGARVWFDAYTLKVGDSLRRSIDQGLAKSRFGVVVLSPAFFEKNWPKYELDGLVAREVAGAKVILPIWHGVSKDDVCGFSPPLADRVAIDTSTHSVEHIADKLCRVLHGDAQPL